MVVGVGLDLVVRVVVFMTLVSCFLLLAVGSGVAAIFAGLTEKRDCACVSYTINL